MSCFQTKPFIARVIFAGGGTGGHVFPGLALMQEFKKRTKCEFLFIGGIKGMGDGFFKGMAANCKTIDLEGFKGRGVYKKLRSVIKFFMAIIPSARFIREFKPDWVIGLGGYSALPVVSAAFLMRKKTAILEQNLLPGLTNRLLAPFAKKIFVSYTGTLKYLPEGKSFVTGNPVRREIIEKKRSRGKRFTVLVFGGSQGARSINTFMVDSLVFLGDIKNKIRIIHQAGKNDRKRVAEAYKKNGFMAEVYDFIEDMAGAYAKSHMAVCRGGATSIAELAVRGIVPLVIPFPYAADGHQDLNAGFLAEQGAAKVIKESEMSGKVMAGVIREFYSDPALLKEREKKMRSLARPDAASNIISMCYPDLPAEGCEIEK